MFFKDILGQSAQISFLKEAVAMDRVPHAIILLGPLGYGAFPLAMSLVSYMTCQGEKGDDACGTCSNCIKNQKLIHPDVHFTIPVTNAKETSGTYLKEWRPFIIENPTAGITEWLQKRDEENKNGNITAEECKEIVKKLSLQSFQGKYKFQLIWMADFLGINGNRLLKIIEEPPANTVFILMAERQEMLLNTIISRCQMIPLNRISEEEIARGLEIKLGLSPSLAEEISRLSDGNFNEAVKLSQNEISDIAVEFLAWMRLAYQGKGDKLLKWIDGSNKKGKSFFAQLFQYGLFFLREMTILKLSPDYKARLREEEMKTAQGMGKLLSVEQIETITDLFNECLFNINRNANLKIMMLGTSIKCNRIMKNKQIAESNYSN